MLSAAAADELGLRPGTPVAQGGIDAYLGMLGLGATGAGDLALIMGSVFVSFAFGDQRVIKEFGIGLAAGILVDAILIRMCIVPSLMMLFGKWNWAFPRWLDRALPRLSVDADDLAAQPADEGGGRGPEPERELAGVSEP